ncbi:ufm1-specific protease 2 [Neocloeon triangulifer]|uniref:ufm1-specific protease 2 n=1 Tax=Neocloeon triangulifer TaxID=2078957 RepID=UPI00286F9394|nr:ufm1-specific protease 2 [Neocloeon triangulifer]
MAPKTRRLLLSNLILEKFSKTEQGFGLAYGLIHDDQYFVLGFILSDESSNVKNLLQSDGNDLSLTSDLLKCWAANQTTLPGGVHIIGNVSIPNEDAFLVDVVEAAIPDIISEEVYHCPETQSPLSLVYKDGTIRASMVDDFMQKEELEYEIVPVEDILENFMLVHLKGQIVINVENSSESIVEEMQEQIARSLTEVFTFNFQSKVFLNGTEEICGADGSKKVDFLLFRDESGKKKKGRTGAEMEVISAELLSKPVKTKTTAEGNDLSKCAPIVQHKKGDIEFLRIPFVVDGLCYVHKDTKIGDLYPILQTCVSRQLLLTNTCLLSELRKTDSASTPVSMHFLSPQNGHFLTLVLPKKLDDSAQESKRQNLHEAFSLDKDRPVFRKGCQVLIKDDMKENSLLINPHVGLSPGIKDAEVAVVYGRYAYHHYMQDNFDDNGWGCAYRSLQTLVSWFRLQGYTDKPVPSHIAIQQCLVDIGDKPANFVGSKQWIGSTEVSFCMETLLGVTCRIMSVSSSEEMCSRVDELLRHFKTQGTPIMIGGGVLAHTILGVAWNPDSDDLRFLILDPHYTQGEDLTVIQTKGWCGWKGPDFWTKTAFYNLCMPQRPICL